MGRTCTVSQPPRESLASVFWHDDAVGCVPKRVGMQKLVLGALFAGVNGLVLWLLLRPDLPVHSAVIAMAAAAFNLVLGIRIGYASAEAYSEDVARLNRHLCDQNEELVASNRELLERLSDGSEIPPTQARKEQGSGAHA